MHSYSARRRTTGALDSGRGRPPGTVAPELLPKDGVVLVHVPHVIRTGKAERPVLVERHVVERDRHPQGRRCLGGEDSRLLPPSHRSGATLYFPCKVLRRGSSSGTARRVSSRVDQTAWATPAAFVARAIAAACFNATPGREVLAEVRDQDGDHRRLRKSALETRRVAASPATTSAPVAASPDDGEGAVSSEAMQSISTCRAAGAAGFLGFLTGALSKSATVAGPLGAR